MPDGHPYEMTVDLNVLNHLGIKLYSSIPAVLSEVVANAWDADAEKVEIEVTSDSITITDDGHGMTATDLNAKFLKVGYQRREEGMAKTPRGRDVLGRKGIGKLSLFSIANTIEVHSRKGGEGAGLVLSLPGIQESIKNKSKMYFPDPVPSRNVSITHGTRIEIRDIRKKTHLTASPLRRRLARRFSSIGRTVEGMKFEVTVNGKEVTAEDTGRSNTCGPTATSGRKWSPLRNPGNSISVARLKTDSPDGSAPSPRPAIS